MFNSKKIEELRNWNHSLSKQVAKLESDLKNATTIQYSREIRLNNGYHSNDITNAPVIDVVQLILDHLNIKIDVEPAKGEKVIIKGQTNVAK